MVRLQNINAEMTRNRINRVTLAKLLDISYRTLSLKLNGARKFTADEIFQISKILQVDINIFFN